MHTLMGILPYSLQQPTLSPTRSLSIRQVSLFLQYPRVSVALLDEALDPQVLAIEVQ